METDKEIAERVARLQSAARDIPMMQLPGYMEWSQRKLDAGESPALIANLDARAMWLLPEDVQDVSVDEYEELLQDLKETLDPED